MQTRLTQNKTEIKIREIQRKKARHIQSFIKMMDLMAKRQIKELYNVK